jgi:hypothetical protein
VKDIHGGAVYYAPTEERTSFFHTDTGSHRKNWRQPPSEVKTMAATFQKWQQKMKIQSFAVASAVLPHKNDRPVEVAKAPEPTQTVTELPKAEKPKPQFAKADTTPRLQKASFKPEAKPAAPALTEQTIKPATSLAPVEAAPTASTHQIFQPEVDLIFDPAQAENQILHALEGPLAKFTPSR